VQAKIHPRHPDEEKAMTTFKQLFRSVLQKFARSQPRPRRFQARLSLEGLETRLVPASVLVVPISQLEDASHFHTLAAGIAAAGVGGVVTIEPGVSPDPRSPVLVDQEGITIQGDPNVPASALPSYQLSVQANAVNIGNLELDSLVVGADASGGNVSETNVHNCVITTLQAFDFESTYTDNVITGSATFKQINAQGGGVAIQDNTFSGPGQTLQGANMDQVLLDLEGCSGAIVSQNTFFEPDGQVIQVHNCHSFQVGRLSIPTTIVDNTISTPGSQFSTAIVVIQDGNGVSNVKIQNNEFDTATGLLMEVSTGDDAHFRAYVEGNDFHNDPVVGVAVIGDSASAGTIDMGGGTLGSLGGNNFRGFAPPVDQFKAAIEIVNAPNEVVAARNNIFSAGVDPADVVFSGPGGGGSADVSNPLSSQRASIQALYNEVLGRTGSLAELDGWVSVLNTQGQSVVVNDILRSQESLGRIVDGFYIRFLGRQSDAGGRAGWISFLQHGGTEEHLETLFVTSPEYLSHINTDFVQSLYINILGRTGDANELAGWNNQIQKLGLAGIANGFTGSVENRTDTLDSYFQTFLHRAPTTTETNTFVNSSADLLSMEGAVLSLPEYFSNG
jgi:hypothetical protein